MAKTRGWSGSPRHTESYGRGDQGHTGPEGPRIGAGALGRRVTPEYVKQASGSGDPKVRNMKTIDQGK